MPDITHRLPANAPAGRVFAMFASPEGLNEWWTCDSAGTPEVGETYRFAFGPEYDWRGLVVACDHGHRIEWEMIEADADWTGTRVGVRLTADGSRTVVDFHHSGWRHTNEHYRTSCCCWAMYLRVLRRFLEHGERVHYADRLDV
jgi:uncharacterized protein YndB with AHSA1/START domain